MHLLHHLSFATNDLPRAGEFYDATLGVLGYRRVCDGDWFIGYGVEERLLVVFCGPDRSYLLDEELGIGGPDTIRLAAASLFRRALTVGAESLLLAHNHPSGICNPSEADEVATHELASLGRRLRIELLDHLIVTRSKIYSMRAGGHFD